MAWRKLMSLQKPGVLSNPLMLEAAQRAIDKKDFRRLTNDELEARIVATIDANIEELGGPEAYLENRRLNEMYYRYVGRANPLADLDDLIMARIIDLSH